MALNDKPLGDIKEQDLLDLIGNIREHKHIEYKSTLPGPTPADKKEFLADVSSFANASGGDLIFGIEAEGGVASALTGLDPASLDVDILRLEHVLRDGMDPRIPNVRIQPIPLEAGAALIVRVPRSWIPPHRVKYGGTSRFYSRNSAGKYELEVSEMRPLFAMSEAATDKIREFRIERLSKIVSGEVNLPLNKKHRLVVHLVPFTAFNPSIRFDLSSLHLETDRLLPLQTFGAWNRPRHNFDGLLSYGLDHNRQCYSYLQLFRNGSVEAVNTSLMTRNEREERSPELYIHVGYEDVVLDFVRTILSLQQEMGVEPPIFVMLSFLGVRGYDIAYSGNIPPGERYPIDQNDLLIPEELIESFDTDIEVVMSRIYRIVWNAAGFSGPPPRN